MIAVTVNGEPRDLEATTTVETLVEMIGCGVRGVAVAVNSEIVARRVWADTTLAGGDRIEVLRAVQGGC
ncbi:MAG TPA: sulfur carrier protein ThiS [Acidimicrobiales bacterium]